VTIGREFRVVVVVDWEFEMYMMATRENPAPGIKKGGYQVMLLERS
jgi:hypothetical protein